MPLSMEVGPGTGHIVLHGDPAPKGHSPPYPNFRPMSVVAKRLIIFLASHFVHSFFISKTNKKSSTAVDMGNRLATIDIGQKVGLQCPFLGVAGSPSNTMWPGPRPNSTPNDILIHQTVWPQYTNATDRTGQTDNGPIG